MVAQELAGTKAVYEHAGHRGREQSSSGPHTCSSMTTLLSAHPLRSPTIGVRGCFPVASLVITARGGRCARGDLWAVWPCITNLVLKFYRTLGNTVLLEGLFCFQFYSCETA